MSSAIGVLLMSAGVFLVWCAVTDHDPLVEMQRALGVDKPSKQMGTIPK